MELIELRRRARQQLGKDSVDLLDMLLVLLGSGDSHIRLVFDMAGVSPEELARLTRCYQARGHSMPQALLTDAICQKEGAPFCDMDLLSFLLHEGSGFLCHLQENGIDTEKIATVAQTAPRAEKAEALHRMHAGGSSLINLTALAKTGQYAALTGRETEIRAIENILLRRDKPNVIVTGSAGVGKTSVIERLVADSLRPDSRLNAYAFYRIDLTEILSATAHRGELEKKLSSVMTALLQDKNAILFMDEIHRFNQAADGSAEGSQVAEILKPFLSRDGIRIIGATTTQEYHKHIARNPTLHRRFQQVEIEELTGENLFAVVRAYANALTSHHHVSIDDTVLRQAIELTEEYMTNRRQPDKANELLDSACVAAAGDGENGVRREHLLRMLSLTTAIPEAILARRMCGAEEIAQRIKQEIFGQGEAIDAVVKTLAVKMSGFREPRSPLASFLFAGDSGVGKTQLAKLLAREILGSESALTIIDMAEYSERHSVSKLVGSPPGYVGSDQEGILPRAIAKNPFGMILFDEIEKAAPEAHQLLLGLLDDGRIRSGLGMEYDARTTTLIFTTNAVTTASIGKQPIGFSAAQEGQSDLLNQLGKSFPTEFLGRIDQAVLFHALTDTDYARIIEQQLQSVREQFARRDVRIVGDDKAVARRLLQGLNHRNLGARAVIDLIRRSITLPVLQKLAESDAAVTEIDLLELTKEASSAGAAFIPAR